MAQPSDKLLRDAIFLVDSSSYIFRAYYAVRGDLSAPDGTPTHATYGFIQMVFALQEQYRPSSIVFVWDTKGPGFRHEIFPLYKANRDAPPEDLSLQIENSKKILKALGYRQEELPGFEADDIIASLVDQNPDKPLVIVTGDKDLLQLVGPRVWALDTLKQKWLNCEEAVEKFGVSPDKICDVQALSGDSVDNVPGASGIGPKGAAELIRTYGSLESVLARAVELGKAPQLLRADEPLKGKKLQSILSSLDNVRVSLELVKLRRDVPNLAPLESVEALPDPSQLGPLFAQLGFQKWSSRFLKHSPALAQQKRFRATQIKNIHELKLVLDSVPQGSVFAWDTETFGLDRHGNEPLVGFSFCWDGQEGFYVPLRHKGSVHPDPKTTVFLFIDFLEKRSDLLWVLQNAKFDWHILACEKESFRPRESEDTMVMSFVLDPSGSHGMDALAQRYLDGWQTISFESIVGKGQTFADVSVETATDYAAEDAVVTWQLHKVLSKNLIEKRLMPVYELLDRPLIPMLWRMEREGLGVDPTRLIEMSREFRGSLAQLESEALDALRQSGLVVSADVNLHSSKQVAQLLFEQLKLPILKRGKTGPSTDVSVLEELANQHPFPKILLEIRELSKLLSTYVEALPQLINRTTHRIHTDLSQTVAATGRLASSNPNLQNIPIRTARGRRVREAFVADPGNRLISADFSQIELRVLAEMSGPGALRQAFFDDADIHRRTAARILAKSESNVQDDERQMAKAINFGIVYGQTAFGLSKALGIPKSEAQRFIDAYFQSYPEIKIYMDRAIESARQIGATQTLTGRIRPLPDIHAKNMMQRQFAERMAINTPVQGSAADLMKAAMMETDRLLQQSFPNSRVLLQVHDELLIEARESDANQIMSAVRQVMERSDLLMSFTGHAMATPLKANVSCGASWGAL